MQGGKAVCSKLFNNSNPLRKKSEGFAGKVRRDKKYVYLCAKSEKTDARIGHPLEVIRTTRNRQK